MVPSDHVNKEEKEKEEEDDDDDEKDYLYFNALYKLLTYLLIRLIW